MIDSRIRKDYDGKPYLNYSVVISRECFVYGRIYPTEDESYAHLDEHGTAWMTDISTKKLRAFLNGEISKKIFEAYVMDKYEDVQEYIRTQNCGTVGYEADDFEEWFWEKAKSWQVEEA